LNGGIVRDQLAKSADRDEGESEVHALIAAAHRIDNLVHQRRLLLAAGASIAGASIAGEPRMAGVSAGYLTSKC